MTNYVTSITVDTVIDALAAYLAPFCIGAQIVRGQGNRVAMPPSPCVILTEINSSDISTPVSALLNSTTASVTGHDQIDVQIDFYGASAGDFARVVKNAFRIGYGYDNFPSTVKPLFMSDAHQHPLTTGEQQYESRWTITASMQYNPAVQIPQDSANTLAIGVVSVERAYPAATVPGAPAITSVVMLDAQTVLVYFSAPTSNGGLPISSYTVVASNGQTSTGTNSPIAVVGLPRLNSYTFVVYATNAIGNGPASAPSSLFTLRTYATWNPADKSSGITLSNGNLTVSGSTGSSLQNQGVRATIALTSGKWSWQTRITSQPPVSVLPAALIGSVMHGIATSQEALGPFAMGSDAFGWCYYNLYQGTKYHNNTSANYGLTLNVNDVVTTKLDLDAGTLGFEVNGMDQGIAFTGITGPVYPTNGVFTYNANFTFGWDTNFGATPFPFPVPAGFNPGVYQ